MKTFLALVLLSFKFCNVFAVDPPQGQLSVEGKKLLGNGKPAALHGMSLFQSNYEPGLPFYTEEVVKALKCQWNSNVVRAAMGIDEGAEAYMQGPEPEQTQKGRVEKVIKAAIEVGIYVIVDWHTHNALSQEVKEKEFFEYIAKTYGKGNKNIIYELFNEPTGGDSDWPAMKVYQQKIVDAIRAIDPDNLILIGTPTWSQGVDTASKDKLTGKNLCYVLHFYAASHKGELRARASTALANDTCIFVSEYGTVNADGNGAVDEGSTKEWWKFLDENNISYVNWAIENKDEGAAALKPGTQASQLGVDERLTTSGSLVKKHLLGQDNGVKCDGSSTGSTSPASTSPTSNGPK